MNRDGTSVCVFPSLEVTTVLNSMLIFHSCFYITPIYIYMHREFIELGFYTSKFYINNIMQYEFFCMICSA